MAKQRKKRVRKVIPEVLAIQADLRKKLSTIDHNARQQKREARAEARAKLEALKSQDA